MSDQTDKAFPVSWEELHRTSKALAWRLLELGPFEGLIAVTRGGLVPAAIVAREMNKPCIIGTKVASNILKTGNMIKMDVGEGTVVMIK